MGNAEFDPTVLERHLIEVHDAACAVADAWSSTEDFARHEVRAGINAALAAALDRLEGATRGSALRRVRP